MLLFQILQKCFKIPGQTATASLQVSPGARVANTSSTSLVLPARPRSFSLAAALARGNELDTPDLKEYLDAFSTPAFIYLPPLQTSFQEEDFRRTPRFPIDKAVSSLVLSKPPV